MFITFYDATLWEIKKKTKHSGCGPILILGRFGVMDNGQRPLHHALIRQSLQTLQYTVLQTTSRISSSQEPSDFLTLIMHRTRVASYVSIIACHIHNGNRKPMCLMCHRYVSIFYFFHTFLTMSC